VNPSAFRDLITGFNIGDRPSWQIQEVHRGTSTSSDPSDCPRQSTTPRECSISVRYGCLHILLRSRRIKSDAAVFEFMCSMLKCPEQEAPRTSRGEDAS
jgi:hypothetical protein